MTNKRCARLCQSLQSYLETHKGMLFATQHRDKKLKRQFCLKGSFKVGTGSSQVGNKQHIGKKPGFKRHNFKNTAVYVTSVENQYHARKINEQQLMAYRMASRIIESVDPDFAGGEYEVNFSLMDSGKHYVKKHKDLKDITHQYALGLGQYSGAKLRVWSHGESIIQDFDYRHKILKLDGRNSHELITTGFQGERFTVIWYKGYDHRMAQVDPICDTPEIVFDFS